jgi:hypothetical protein
MELDDLKERWAQYDRKLDAAIHLNTQLLKATLHGKAETALRRLSRWLWIELALNAVVVLWLGSFFVDHLAEFRFWVPALGLFLCALALIIACVHQLLAISQVDYGAPVVAIQSRLESLRIFRIRATKWTLLLSPLLWTPLFIVSLKSFFDVDAYDTFSSAWLTANVLFGVLVIPVALWICNRLADRVKNSPLLRQLMRDIAGRNLTAATEFLHSLARFAED